jgi:hypothetical protein
MLFSQRARVAELADAPDSKSGGRKAVWVRFPPRAPIFPADFATYHCLLIVARCCHNPQKHGRGWQRLANLRSTEIAKKPQKSHFSQYLKGFERVPS